LREARQIQRQSQQAGPERRIDEQGAPQRAFARGWRTVAAGDPETEGQRQRQAGEHIDMDDDGARPGTIEMFQQRQADIGDVAEGDAQHGRPAPGRRHSAQAAHDLAQNRAEQHDRHAEERHPERIQAEAGLPEHGEHQRRQQQIEDQRRHHVARHAGIQSAGPYNAPASPAQDQEPHLRQHLNHVTLPAGNRSIL